MQVEGTPRYYRVKAIAEMYDVSPSTIYRAIEAGHLDALRIGTGKGAIRIPEYALGAFVESCVLEPGDAAKDPEIRAGAVGADDTTSTKQAGEVA